MDLAVNNVQRLICRKTQTNLLAYNGPGDYGSIPDHVIPKTLKMVLDTSLLNTQHKVRIKGKVERSKRRELRPPLHIGVVAFEKGSFWSSSTTVANRNTYN